MARTYFPFGYWPPRALPGWHWPNLSHGHYVYRGRGGLSAVDFSRRVGFAQADATRVVLTGLGHDAATRHTYAVRPVAGNGWLGTADYGCACPFETDDQGNWLDERPAAVEWLAATVLGGGSIRLAWSWRRPPGGVEPQDFALYCAAAADIEPGSPQAVEAYAGDGLHEHVFGLEDGKSYWFAVTARSAAGRESHLSAVIGPYVADAAPPAAPQVEVSPTF